MAFKNISIESLLRVPRDKTKKDKPFVNIYLLSVYTTAAPYCDVAITNKIRSFLYVPKIVHFSV